MFPPGSFYECKHKILKGTKPAGLAPERWISMLWRIKRQGLTVRVGTARLAKVGNYYLRKSDLSSRRADCRVP
jgi:hypothetical protein